MYEGSECYYCTYSIREFRFGYTGKEYTPKSLLAHAVTRPFPINKDLVQHEPASSPVWYVQWKNMTVLEGDYGKGDRLMGGLYNGWGPTHNG